MQLQAERDAERGIQRVAVRIPADRAEELRDIARKWLRKYERHLRENLPGQGHLDL